MENRFDTCSYEELTGCVEGRIAYLREYKKLCSSGILADYPVAHANALLHAAVCRMEIRALMEMRRIMKRRGAKHWRDIKEEKPC